MRLKTLLLCAIALAAAAVAARADEFPPALMPGTTGQLITPWKLPNSIRAFPGAVNQKVGQKEQQWLSPTLKKTVQVTTTAVSMPLYYLRDTLFLVRTEFKGMLLLHLPFIDTDPNRGLTYGVMPTLLVPVTDPDGTTRIGTVFAPSLTYNSLFGWDLALRLLHYTTVHEDVTGTLEESQRVNHTTDFEYKTDDFWGDHFLYLHIRNERDGSNRFYGIGDDSKEKGQSNYTDDWSGYDLNVGMHVATHCVVGAENRIQAYEVLPGVLSGIPSTTKAYPTAVPPGRLNLSYYRVYTSYDTRDSKNTPSRGKYANFYLEISPKEYGSAVDYWTYGTDIRGYFPQSPTLVFTPRVKFQMENGNGIPFYELSELGGQNTLRGYGDGRFLDRGMGVVGAEERWTGFQANVMDTPIAFEFGPFAEAGTVFSEVAYAQSKYIKPVAGLFLRGVARPQIVGSIDVGEGAEGTAVFVHIDYSW